MSWLLDLVFAFCFSCAGILVTLLPRKFEIWFAPYLGIFLSVVAKKRFEIARSNMQLCFPNQSEEFYERLQKKNFTHYGILVLELLHLFSPFPGHYQRYVKKNSRCIGFENWKRAFDKGKGVLFVSSHLANWELMLGVGGLIGIELAIVTKHLKPEWVHKKIESARAECGVKGIYEPRTLPAVLRELRAKKSVGFVMDQYAGPPIGIKVPFFGIPVGTLAAVGTICSRTGAAIIPVRTYRNTEGEVVAIIESEIELSPDQASDEVFITSLLAKKVEDWIKQSPQDWLWTHRRFKNIEQTK